MDLVWRRMTPEEAVACYIPIDKPLRDAWLAANRPAELLAHILAQRRRRAT
jgi:hypothetical protein